MADNPQYITDLQRRGYDALGGSGLLSGFGNWSGTVAPWNSLLGAAQTNAGLLGSNNKDWSSQIAGSGQLDPNAFKAFMDPYAQAVGNDTINAITDSYDNRDADAAARAASGVAFGGSGSALALERGQNARSEATDKASAMNGIMSQAFNAASGLAEGNAARGQSGLIAADNASTGYDNRAINDINSLLGVGGVRQAFDQQTADLPWTNFQRFMGALPGGVNSDPVPLWQQILGFLGGLGGSALSGGLLNGVFNRGGA